MEIVIDCAFDVTFDLASSSWCDGGTRAMADFGSGKFRIRGLGGIVIRAGFIGPYKCFVASLVARLRIQIWLDYHPCWSHWAVRMPLLFIGWLQIIKQASKNQSWLNYHSVWHCWHEQRNSPIGDAKDDIAIIPECTEFLAQESRIYKRQEKL